MFVRVSAMAAVCLSFAGAASAQGVREQAEAKLKTITADLQTHTAAAKAEGGKGQEAMRANDKAGACESFKKARTETGTVLNLLSQQREQVMIATEDAATALARANKIDEMAGSYITLAAQIEARVTATCS